MVTKKESCFEKYFTELKINPNFKDLDYVFGKYVEFIITKV